MQQVLDHLSSRKLKSSTALVLQSHDGKQLISNGSNENAETYKDVANEFISEQTKLVCHCSVCRRNINDRYVAAYGSFDNPHWAALVLLWDCFRSKDKQDDNDENRVLAVHDDFKWLKANWTRLVSTFNAADDISREQQAKREKMTTVNRIEHGIARLPSSSPVDVASEITKLFENVLLKRNRKIKADECWDTVGVKIFTRQIENHVRIGMPIPFVMPSFPFKSGNTRTKVLGTLPDMAEKLGLERLEGFLADLRSIYSPGGKLLIFTDGRVYCDLFRIPDSSANEFTIALRKMVDPKTSDIEWTNLDEIYPNPHYSDEDKRQALLNVFGTSLEKVVDRINSDADFCEVYKGFKKFMREELTFPSELGDRAVRQECGKVGKLLVQRTDAYQALIRCLYPNYVRLSIHPSTSTTKFSVDLVGKTDWGTPWHNCALLQPDQTWALVRRGTAEKHGFELCKRDDGMHYFVNNSGTIFTEKL